MKLNINENRELTIELIYEEKLDYSTSLNLACEPDCEPFCNPGCNPDCGPHCDPHCIPICSPSCEPCFPFSNCDPDLFYN